MCKRSALLLTGLAVLIMGLGVSAASARNLSVSSQTFSMTWSRFQFVNGMSEQVLQECPVTLEGRFTSRTFTKAESGQIGQVTRAEVAGASCNREVFSTGASLAAETLPWALTYESFAGTLPRITGLNLYVRNRGERLFFMREQCLYEGAMGLRLGLSAAGTIESVEGDPPRTLLLRRSGNSFICPGSITDRGSGAVTVEGGITHITVTLI